MVSGSDAYHSIAAEGEGLYKDRGSRFISYAYPVTSVEEVKPLVDALKKEHHGARHHCYAYRIGHDGAAFRANDDGEPSGSAGRPILGAIDSAGLSDILIVVVRYFGGILLGVPGLINAYRQAAADAIAHSTVVEKLATSRLRLEFGYEAMNDVQRIVKGSGTQVADQQFDLQCVMDVDVRLGGVDDFLKTINSYNNEKGTCIQCRPLHSAQEGN